MVLLRSYPTITSLIDDWFGINIPLPIQSFGFFVALGFLAAAYFTIQELKRKEREGRLHATKKKVVVNKPPTMEQYALNGLIGFILGFKILAALLNYQACSADPQGFVFSMEGSFLGGLLGAVIAIVLKYWPHRGRSKNEKPKEQIIEVWPHQRIGDIVVLAAIGGFLGAKIFHFLEYPDDFQNFLRDPGGNIFSGLTIYGGLILGAIAVIWYARKHQINVLHMADAAAPGLILAYGIGRIGCHVSGDGDWGIANPNPKPDWLSWLPDGLWSNHYAHNINGEGVPIEGCEGPHCAMLDPGVYPTPIYELGMTLIIFGILWALRKRLGPWPGMIMAAYLVFNGIERFLIEQIRVNIRYDFGFIQPTQAEILSLVFVLAGVAMAAWVWSRGRKTAPAQH